MLRFTSASLARTNLSAKIVTFLPETSSRGYNSCGNLPDLTPPPLPLLYIYVFVDVHVHVLDQVLFCISSYTYVLLFLFCYGHVDRILYICRSKDVNKVTDCG